MRPRVISNDITMAYKLRELVRMNPPVFLGSRVEGMPNNSRMWFIKW